MSGAEGYAPGARMGVSGELYRNTNEKTGERRQWPQTVRRIGALGLALTLAHGLQAYKADVDEVKSMVAHTHSYVTEYASPPDNDPTATAIPRGAYETLDPAERSYVENANLAAHTAIIDMSGFGKKQNDHSERFMKGLGELGAGWTLHYSSEGIYTLGIAHELVDRARADPRGINRLAFYGDSMGTIVALDVAAKVAEIAPDINIPFIVLDSPAVNLSVLRPQSIQDGYALLDGMHIPDAQYSRYLRVLGEMYLRRFDIQRDPGSFMNVFRQVCNQVFANKDLPATSLLAEQFQIIMNSTAEKSIQTFGSLPEAQRTMIFFTGAANAKRDDVVNISASYQYLKKWTGEAGVPFHRLSGVNNFFHGDPARSKNEYVTIFRKEVVPEVINAEGRGQDQRIG